MRRQAWKIILLWAAVIALCVIVARAKADQSPQEQGGALWHEPDAVLSREQTQPMSTGDVRSGTTAPLSQHLVSPCATVTAAATASTGSQRTTLPSTNLTERETHRRETDPFRRCATKALAGTYGTLAPWQEHAYRWGLAHGLTVPAGNLSRVTSYGPFEPCGTETFSGEHVSLKWVSVDPKHVPLGAIIWTPRGLRYAMDTGGAVKVANRYLRAGENQNLDYYALNDWGRITLPWVIVKTSTRWNWYGLRKWRDWSRQGPWHPGVK